MFTVIFNIILFVLILGSIVLVHEFGHFIFAKMAGVYVYEFAIGMGPVLWKKKGKETEYSIRAIPIGGFCAMAGEDVEADDENEIPKGKRLQDKNIDRNIERVKTAKVLRRVLESKKQN